jgi:hypothetical protein
MSHFSLIKIRIRNPDPALLRRAVEMIAEELGGELVTRIQDYYGRTMEVLLGIVNETFRRGIGVRVNERGEVEVVGDFFLVPSSAVTRFKELLVRNYTTLALQTALVQLGYRVQAQKVNERIFIRGVAP